MYVSKFTHNLFKYDLADNYIRGLFPKVSQVLENTDKLYCRLLTCKIKKKRIVIKVLQMINCYFPSHLNLIIVFNVRY